MLNIQSSQIPKQRLNKPSQNINFGRALASDERKISNLLLDRTFQINAVDLRAMIMPGAANPAYTMQDKDGKALVVDTGIGSPFSKSAIDQVIFAKDVMGINAIQQLPMGGGAQSPFSSSVFERGAHLVDPGKMYEMGLVTREDIEKLNVPQEHRYPWRNNYQNYFEKKGDDFFQKAFVTFQDKLQNDSGLKEQYNAFLDNKTYKKWLEPNSIDNALAANLYKTDDYRNWTHTTQKSNPDCTLEIDAKLDQRIFSALKDKKDPMHEAAKARLTQIKADPACQKSIELFNFKQFVAYKQNEKMYAILTQHNIKNIDDVPIGVHISDTYGFQDAFMLDLNAKNSRGISTLGCPTKEGKVSDWGMMGLKPNSKAAQDFVELKYRNALENADTARVDAAWQLRLQNVIHNHDNDQRVELVDMGEQGLFPSVKNAFIDAGKADEVQNIVAENLPDYQEWKQTTGKALDELGMSQIELEKPNCPTTRWGSPGIHDQPSLLSHTPYREDQIDKFAQYLKGEHNGQGPRKIMFMFADLFGRGEQYNVPGSHEAPNWTMRQPENFEEFYFKQLAGDNEFNAKSGLNAYKAAKRAMQNKNIIDYKDGNIISKADQSFAPDVKIVAELLQHFEDVVEEKGVYTTAEATSQSEKLMEGLHNKFGKKAVGLLVAAHDTLANKANNTEGLKKLMLSVSEAVEEHRKTVVITPNADETTTAQEPISGTLENATNTAVTETSSNNIENATNKAVTETSSNTIESAAKESGKEVSETASKNFKHGKLVAIGVGVAAVGGLATMYYSSQKKAEEAAHKKHKTNHKTQYA